MATILLISENAASLEKVRIGLSISGHEVLLVRSDVELIEVARTRRFDLALIDLERAELADLAREVSGKMVLFSGASADVTHHRVKQARAHGYVRKLGPERVREDLLRYISAAQ